MLFSIDSRIKLRPLKDSDRSGLVEYINNEHILVNLRDFIPDPYSEKDAIDFIRESNKEKPPVTFAIEYMNRFCGVIALVPRKDVYRKTAEIGYWIGEPFWGKGIATEATRLITDYGLHTLGFIRIQTGVFEYNTASMRVLEKCGYQRDGIYRKAVIKNGKIFSEYRYSIVK